VRQATPKSTSSPTIAPTATSNALALARIWESSELMNDSRYRVSAETRISQRARNGTGASAKLQATTSRNIVAGRSALGSGGHDRGCLA
jgi:hypothetical protein